MIGIQRTSVVTTVLLGTSIWAQPVELRSELEFSSGLTLSKAFAPQGGWGLGAHIEARYNIEGAALHLVLDPEVRFDREVQSDPGLTEAYLKVRLESLDFGAGIERLPLEVARLSVPYSIEATNKFGQRLGLLGIRASWNPELTRVRLALLEDPSGWFGALSVRQEFGGFELEGHVLAPRGRVVVGLGGSGTLADLVLYGEVWGLSNPWEGRYLLGISGNLEDGLWMMEGGYASPLAGAPPRHLLAGQIGWQQDPESSWSFTGVVFFDDALREQAGLAYSLSSDVAEWTVGLGGLFGPEPTIWSLRLGVRSFL